MPKDFRVFEFVNFRSKGNARLESSMSCGKWPQVAAADTAANNDNNTTATTTTTSVGRSAAGRCRRSFKELWSTRACRNIVRFRSGGYGKSFVHILTCRSHTHAHTLSYNIHAVWSDATMHRSKRSCIMCLYVCGVCTCAPHCSASHVKVAIVRLMRCRIM